MSRILLTIVLLDVGRFEVLWVLDVIENATEGWKPIEVIYKMRLASCINDFPCVRPIIGDFFMVVAVVVVAVLLKPWSLVSCGLSTPRTLAASDFLLLLVSSVLLLLTMIASRSASCLWCY